MKLMSHVYVLREDMYHEWAWENGATNLIIASDNIYTIADKLREFLKLELSEDKERIVENLYGKREIDNIITDTIDLLLTDRNFVSIDVYTNEDNYQNGLNHGTFVIERMDVK